MCEPVSWIHGLCPKTYTSGHFALSAPTLCRKGQFSSRLVHHVCFACPLNCPKMATIGLCTAENGCPIIQVSQNRCRALLCSQWMQVHIWSRIVCKLPLTPRCCPRTLNPQVCMHAHSWWGNTTSFSISATKEKDGLLGQIRWETYRSVPLSHFKTGCSDMYSLECGMVYSLPSLSSQSNSCIFAWKF